MIKKEGWITKSMNKKGTHPKGMIVHPKGTSIPSKKISIRFNKITNHLKRK